MSPQPLPARFTPKRQSAPPPPRPAVSRFIGPIVHCHSLMFGFLIVAFRSAKVALFRGAKGDNERQPELLGVTKHQSEFRLDDTPAMAAKVASHPWSIEELYEKVMATVEA